MREDGGLTIPAILALGGVDLGYYLKARWPDDQGVLEALAVEIREMRREERKDLAVRVADKVGEMLDKSLG